MSKWNKLLLRLYRLDSSLRYEELKNILESYGYNAQETSGGSSHITFRKECCQPITIPRHGKIKKIYLGKIRDAVEMTVNDRNNK